MHSLDRDYHRTMQAIVAFILAGGRSSRMGADKALLELNGKPLIVHTIELARQVSRDVKIVGNPLTLASYGAVIEDVYRGRGPLGGIHAALTASESDWNLILAVDLPFLTVPFLKYLIAESQASGVTVTVPSTDGFLHPLCGVYRKQFAIVAERALAEARNKIDALYPEVSLRVISEEEMLDNGLSSAMFRNLNTPEEWEQARQSFATRPL